MAGWFEQLMGAGGGRPSLEDQVTAAHARWIDYSGTDDEMLHSLFNRYEALSAARRRELG